MEHHTAGRREYFDEILEEIGFLGLFFIPGSDLFLNIQLILRPLIPAEGSRPVIRVSDLPLVALLVPSMSMIQIMV